MSEKSLEERFDRSKESIRIDRNLYVVSGILGAGFFGAIACNYYNNLMIEGNFTELSTYFDLGISAFTGTLAIASGIISYYGISKNIIK